MKIFIVLLIALAPASAADEGWTQLFNGNDLTGWKASENQSTFTVKDGAIVSHGPRSHCFYVGEFHNHLFKDYELKVDIMTLPGSNGGVFIDTEYQEQGWPARGFEVQVNNTYKGDERRTASLYEVKDNNDAGVARDNVWFTEHIVVKGNHITIKVDDKIIEEWTEPADWAGTKDFPGRRIAPGTIALQGHDPASTVYYKNIRIKPLD
jgi:hypothetical protein